MPIVNTFQINRYKQIPVTLTPGNIPDGGFSTFELNSKFGDRRGTSDFDGVLKRLVLLGEVQKNILNTGIISIQQFNSMDDSEVEERVQNGSFARMTELIGWVELGTSHPSFYYEDCTTSGKSGKRPKSDNYYDLTEMNVSPYLVNGNAVGLAALQRLNNWNSNEALGRWGASPYPEQPQMNLNAYLDAAIKSGFLPNMGGGGGRVIPKLLTTQIFGIPLLMGDYLEHFEESVSLNPTFTLGTMYSNIESDAAGTEKKVYGRLRRQIQNGFKPIGIIPREFPELNNISDIPIFENRTTIGECILRTVQLDGKVDMAPSYFPIFYTNDSEFTSKTQHPKITAANESILYYGFDSKNIDSIDSTNNYLETIKTPYSPKGTPDIGNPKYFTPDPYKMNDPGVNPTIEPDIKWPRFKFENAQPGDTDARWWIPTEDFGFGSNGELVKKSKNSILIGYVGDVYFPKNTSKWKQDKSYNLNANNQLVFTPFKRPTAEAFVLKNRVKNSGLSIDEYKENLIRIKNELNQKRKNALEE